MWPGKGGCLIMGSDPRQGWEPPQGASHRHLHRRREAKALPSATRLRRAEPGRGSTLLTPVPGAPSGADCKSTCRRAPWDWRQGSPGLTRDTCPLPCAIPAEALSPPSPPRKSTLIGSTRLSHFISKIQNGTDIGDGVGKAKGSTVSFSSPPQIVLVHVPLRGS